MPAQLPYDRLRGTGLAQVLSTSDFAEWEAATSCTLGHHRSRLLDPNEGFEAHYRLGSAGPLQVLHIRGRGRVELERTQQTGVVLWLPLLGSSQEQLNGTPMGAEPGMALLFRPGDEMLGRTSEDLEGISVLIPESLLPGSGHPLLERGPRAREVIAQALALAEATALGQPGLEHGALALVEVLRIWQREQGESETHWRERLGAVRARTLVNEAIVWMESHLGEAFAVADLASELSTSVRSLQYAFQQELGHPPLAEARRQRLRLLRAHLLDPDQSRTPIGMLMAECGLLGGGSTARDYRSFWGELPRRTRQRLGKRDSAAEDGRALGWARPRSSLDC